MNAALPAGVTEKDVQLFTQAQDNAKAFLAEENKSLLCGDMETSPTATLSAANHKLLSTPKAGGNLANLGASPALNRPPSTPKAGASGVNGNGMNTPARTPGGQNQGKLDLMNISLYIKYKILFVFQDFTT